MARRKNGTESKSPRGAPRAHALAVGLERFERRRRRLFDLGVVALHRRQRLAELFAERRHRARPSPAARSSFDAACTCSSASTLPLDAVLRVERQHVRRAEHGDRAAEQRLRAGALADFAADLGGDRRHRLAAHQPQRRLHLLLGHEVQERRLPQLHAERFAERVVEHRVAGAIDDRRQHHGVFARQRRRA